MSIRNIRGERRGVRAIGGAVLALAALAPVAAGAQWLNHPTPGIPQTADGRPDMNAPAVGSPAKKR